MSARAPPGGVFARRKRPRKNNLIKLRPRVARPEQDAKGVWSGLHALRVLLRACHPRSQLVQVNSAQILKVTQLAFQGTGAIRGPSDRLSLNVDVGHGTSSRKQEREHGLYLNCSHAAASLSGLDHLSVRARIT